MFRISCAYSGAIGTGVLLLAIAAPPAAAQATRLGLRPDTTLSAFSMDKAEKLPCLGCHDLDGEGGAVGPSLSNLRGVRPTNYVYAMIGDPQGTVPGTVMPQVPMREQTLVLIVNYLVQREPGTHEPPPTFPQPIEPTPVAEITDPKDLYERLCAACHGPEGNGNGENAAFLPVQPTVHSDSAYMSARPDDSLFDAIYAGGLIMGRSNLMPPYGRTLSYRQIRELVRYQRTLCGCEGPAWSRDNRK
jgi:mono/diheme cytochrome c family protein